MKYKKIKNRLNQRQQQYDGQSKSIDYTKANKRPGSMSGRK